MYVSLLSFSQTEPTITFYTALKPGKWFIINIISKKENIKIDLGDGVIKSITSGMYKGKVVGEKIRLYGDILKLAAANNSIVSVDIKTHDLVLLNLNSNDLTTFSLPQSDKLISLSLEQNKLTNIALPKKLPLLTTLNLKRNKLSIFNNVEIPELKMFIASNNLFDNLDLSMYTKLKSIRVSNCKLKTINIPTGVMELYADKNQLHLNENYFLPCKNIKSIRLNYNCIDRLCIKDCVKLNDFEVRDNSITWIKFSNLPMLKYVDLRLGNLSAEILDSLYAALPVAISGNIKVKGNIESENAHGDIVTSKGWKIDVIGKLSNILKTIILDQSITFDANAKELCIPNYLDVIKLNIYNAKGEKLFSDSPTKVFKFDNLKTGIYFIEIIKSNGSRTVEKVHITEVQ